MTPDQINRLQTLTNGLLALRRELRPGTSEREQLNHVAGAAMEALIRLDLNPAGKRHQPEDTIPN